MPTFFLQQAIIEYYNTHDTIPCILYVYIYYNKQIIEV